MQTWLITTTPKTVNLAPATVLEEVLQNVYTILTTVRYSVPLERGFGLDGELIDLPIPVAQAKMSASILQQIAKYEPRCKVVRISYVNQSEGDTADGILRPVLEVAIIGS